MWPQLVVLAAPALDEHLRLEQRVEPLQVQALGMDITRRPRGMFIIDFGTDMPAAEAAAYEAPFAHLEEFVRLARSTKREQRTWDRWWLHTRPIRGMRRALAPLPRFIGTPTLAKHRLFVWLAAPTLPDHQLVVIARADDYAFGVLHSRAHELWSLRMGTWLGVGNASRYTPTSTFETFPFPWPLDTPDEALTAEQRAHRDAIARVALALDETRRRWLNPPELVREESDIVPSLPPRLLPVDKDAERVLKRRTLTNLDNERPAWLSQPPRSTPVPGSATRPGGGGGRRSASGTLFGQAGTESGLH